MKELKVNLKLPYIGGVEGVWEPDESERRAAWELYVELVTRVSVVELRPEEGLLREALSSLYSLFDTTRKILRQYGPSIAQAKGDGDLSLGYVAVAILNTVLRPLLSEWHPLLLEYEGRRSDSVSVAEHEKQWERAGELREALNGARGVLIEYAGLLATAAEVPPLIPDRPSL